MFIIHTRYYANYYVCITTLKTTLMKLDKKILYRHIVMLQLFANAYRTFLRHSSDGTHIFEVSKLFKDSSGNMQKVISFALSREQLPTFLDFDSVINYDVTLLSESKIKSYLFHCKEYGIGI